MEIIENFVVYLSYLLETWKENIEDIGTTVMVTQIGEYLEPEDNSSLKILITKINLVNTTNQNQFVYLNQFIVEESRTYLEAMQDPNAAKWVNAIEQKLDQLYKNKTWKLIHKSEIELDYEILEEK